MRAKKKREREERIQPEENFALDTARRNGNRLRRLQKPKCRGGQGVLFDYSIDRENHSPADYGRDRKKQIKELPLEKGRGAPSEETTWKQIKRPKPVPE